MYLNAYVPSLQTGAGFVSWISRATAMTNHYYVYILDRDFGPLFIKFCSYFPC